jgi:hypothetical protein
MKFSLPTSLPLRSEFLQRFLNDIFPDIERLGYTNTGYGYTKACQLAALSLGLIDDSAGDIELSEDSNMFRFMYALGEYYEHNLGLMPILLKNRNYQRYSESLHTFCDETNGSLRGWLRHSNTSNKINKSFDTAVFLGYLILSRPESSSKVGQFFEYCLNTVGITDIDPPVYQALLRFNWTISDTFNKIEGRSFRKLTNRSVIAFGATILTILEYMGTYDPDKDQNGFQEIHQFITELFVDEIKVADGLLQAQTSLLNNIRYFDPRSIPITSKLHLEDIFVVPRFMNNGSQATSPFHLLRDAKKSKRLLVMARTGLGKSAYIQMSSLCMLHSSKCVETDRSTAILNLAKELNVPEDMYIISVPAKMFSACYKEDRYRDWTNDFVTLFFNCMWTLSNGNNFFSNQVAQLQDYEPHSSSSANFKMTDAFLDYVGYLARKGKLVLILDSFDEISTGKMRQAYLKSLAAFYDKYCFFLNATDVGAHVIVSSRELSPKTMVALTQSLEIDLQANSYTIQYLQTDQQRELIYKWNRFRGRSEQDSQKLLQQITTNRYYQDFSLNPYMLSVVCYDYGHEPSYIIEKYIKFLSERLLRNNRTGDQIEMVLMNIVKILQTMAAESVISGNPIIPRQKLDRSLRHEIDKTDLSPGDIDDYIERLHEILTAEVGLIVPAEGNDTDYQFINDQIRYEFAANGIQRTLSDDEKRKWYRETVFPSIANVGDYVNLIVHLLCNIKTEEVELAEQLVTDLVLTEFANSSEDKTLLTGMIDLLLSRYGSNIITPKSPGVLVKRLVHRAQKILIMRLLASKNFCPSDQEKQEIKESPAYLNNKEWLKSELKLTLDE